MRAASIQRKLRALDVPLEKAKLAAERFGDDGGIPTPTQLVEKELRKAARQKSAELERRKFRAFCTANSLPLPVAEHCFSTSRRRRHRFDFAWPNVEGSGGIALEVNGGVWMQGGGRHNRGQGYLNDLDKLNLAVELRWRVLQRTPQNLFTDDTVAMLRPLLAALTESDRTDTNPCTTSTTSEAARRPTRTSTPELSCPTTTQTDRPTSTSPAPSDS